MVIVKDIIIAHVRHAVCTLDSYTSAIGGINLSKNRKMVEISILAQCQYAVPGRHKGTGIFD